MAKLIPDFVLREFEYEHLKNEEAGRRREASAPDWATTPYALTGGKYTGIGAADCPEEPKGADGQTKRAQRDDEDRAW